MPSSIAHLIVEMSERGASSLIGTVGRIGAAVGVAATALGGMGLAAAAANEQADISFTTMLGSAEKAQGFLTDMRDFAAKTPFEFPELQTAASSLISVGVEAKDVIPIMTTLGNVTSGMGTGSEGVKRATIALQQMSAAGRITGEDLNQLRDAGIPVFDLLAGATGKTKTEIAAMAQSGKLGKAELDAMFESLKTGGAGLERFSGLMDQQSRSLTGMVSTLKDTVKQGLAGAMAPVLPMIKDNLGDVSDALSEFMSGLSAPIGQLFTGLAPAIGPVISLVGSLLNAFAPLLGVFGQVAGVLAAQLQPVMTRMAPVIGEIGMSMGRFLIALVPIVPVIGDLLMAVLPLLPPLINLATAILPTLISILDVGKPVILAVAAAFLAIQVAGLISSFIALIPVVAGLAVSFWALVAPLLPIIAIVAAVGAAIYLLWRNWDTVWNAMKAAGEAVVAALVVAIDWLKGAISGAASWIGDRISDIIGFFASLPGRAWEAAVGLISTMWDLGTSALGQLKDAVLTGLSEVVGFVAELPGRALNALGNLGSVLFDAGRQLINGFVDGIKSAFGWVKDTLGNLAGKLFSWKGPPARDAVLLYEAGQLVIGGFVRGLESKYGDVRSSLGEVTSMVGGTTPSVTSSSGARGGGATTIILTIDGQEFARVIAPAMRDQLIDIGRHLPGGAFGAAA